MISLNDAKWKKNRSYIYIYICKIKVELTSTTSSSFYRCTKCAIHMSSDNRNEKRLRPNIASQYSSRKRSQTYCYHSTRILLGAWGYAMNHHAHSKGLTVFNTHSSLIYNLFIDEITENTLRNLQDMNIELVSSKTILWGRLGGCNRVPVRIYETCAVCAGQCCQSCGFSRRAFCAAKCKRCYKIGRAL